MITNNLDIKYKKVIIIGAGRSGTNMLRDVLTSFEGIETWPCDEINYIWRHGNTDKKDDEFKCKDATNNVIKYINNAFDRLHSKKKCNIVVEKTCANSLRVQFVKKIIPEALYINIYRNPIDVVSSAMERWKADLDLKYIFKKARFVPILDLPKYTISYLVNRAYKLVSNEENLAYWGPVYKGMKEMVQNDEKLHIICATQWKRCIKNSIRDFKNISDKKIYHLSYESFVTNPKKEIYKILRFIGLNSEEYNLDNAIKNVTVNNVGKGLKILSSSQVMQVQEITNEAYKEVKNL